MNSSELKHAAREIDIVQQCGMSILESYIEPEIAAEYVSFSDLELCPETQALFQGYKGIYRHQRKAIQAHLEGENVTISTSTASGKSLVFHTCAIHRLFQAIDDVPPNPVILALYPMKALGRDQEQKWIDAILKVGLPKETVGRIDGDISVSQREETLAKSQVILATPDVIHAWLMSATDNNVIKSFLSRMVLCCIDEIHLYDGVFGTNMAYLLRRMRYLCNIQGACFQIIAATATIADPLAHSTALTGEDNFHLIGEEDNTAPVHRKTFLLIGHVEPDLLTSDDETSKAPHVLSGSIKGEFRKTLEKVLMAVREEQFSSSILCQYLLVSLLQHRMITFMDNRKRVEMNSVFLDRLSSFLEERFTDSDVSSFMNGFCASPYKSGYEREDVDKLTRQLVSGNITHVTSTSALEVGVDIGDLSVCWTDIGSGFDTNSLVQRFGRVGRAGSSFVILNEYEPITNKNMLKRARRRFEQTVHPRPYQPLLYLNSTTLCLLHAQCLLGPHGELTKLNCWPAYLEVSELENWFPEEFLYALDALRENRVDLEYEYVICRGHIVPQKKFGLRYIPGQFQVEHVYKDGQVHSRWSKTKKDKKGTLNWPQVLQEAYPGGIYFYLKRTYQVKKISRQSREIAVYPVFRKPVTTPMIETLGWLYDIRYLKIQYGDFYVIQGELLVEEKVTGYKSNGIEYSYPLQGVDRIKYDYDDFARIYATRGCILAYPSKEELRGETALALKDAYLQVATVCGNDLGIAYVTLPPSLQIETGCEKGLAFYELSDCSNVSERLMDKLILRETLSIALDDVLMPESKELLRLLVEAVDYEPQTSEIYQLSNLGKSETLILLPGSLGYRKSTQEKVSIVAFELGNYFKGGYQYRVRPASYVGNKHLETIVQMNDISWIPGVSKLTIYDLELGESKALFEQNSCRQN